MIQSRRRQFHARLDSEDAGDLSRRLVNSEDLGRMIALRPERKHPGLYQAPAILESQLKKRDLNTLPKKLVFV